MNEPSRMYTLQPAFSSCVKIEYPKCMYSMKNVLVDVAEPERSCNNSCAQVHLDEKRPMTILEQVNNFLKKPVPGMEELEIRQEVILEQLAQLKLQVASLRANLSQSAPVPNKRQKAGIASNNITANIKASLLEHVLVINVSPEYPPYSLFALCQLWKQSIRLNISWHTHSNVAEVPDCAKSFMAANWNSNSNDNLPLLKMSVVWKNVGPDTELMVTPMSRIAIRGEVNILRFLSHQGPALFSTETENNPLYTTEVDEILDTCHSLSWSRSVKDRQALLRSLNGKLRKSQFLMGDTLTIADIAAWSVIKQMGARQDITVNMGKWLERCSELCSEK